MFADKSGIEWESALAALEMARLPGTPPPRPNCSPARPGVSSREWASTCRGRCHPVSGAGPVLVPMSTSSTGRRHGTMMGEQRRRRPHLHLGVGPAARSCASSQQHAYRLGGHPRRVRRQCVRSARRRVPVVESFGRTLAVAAEQLRHQFAVRRRYHRSRSHRRRSRRRRVVVVPSRGRPPSRRRSTPPPMVLRAAGRPSRTVSRARSSGEHLALARVVARNHRPGRRPPPGTTVPRATTTTGPDTSSASPTTNPDTSDTLPDDTGGGGSGSGRGGSSNDTLP